MVLATMAPGSARHSFTITPSDSVVFNPPLRYIWIGGQGSTDTLVIMLESDTVPVTLAGVPTGVMLQLAIVKVMSATTATNIVGFY
jgi:hypothetical protein